jgi:hypothetical protein
MIKGNIDFISQSSVRGWIHIPSLSYTGIEIGAYVKNHCVGRGLVDVYRQDLAEIGLGNGWSGFDFKINVFNRSDLLVLDIRIDNCDFVLLPSSNLLLPFNKKSRIELINLRDDTLWLRANGILSEYQFNIIRILWKFGVCNIKLKIFDLYRESILSNDIDLIQSSFQILIDSNTITLLNKVFEFFTRKKNEVNCLHISSQVEWNIVIDALRLDSLGSPPIVAIWSIESFFLQVLESTHASNEVLASSSEDSSNILGSTVYEVNFENIVFLNIDVTYSFDPSILEKGVVYLLTAGSLAA